MMSSTSDSEYGRDTATDPGAEADSRPDGTELEETTRFAAADSGWSAGVLREATNLLTAGKSREVARLCHQVIEQEPQNIASYEMLAMAEEENGNLRSTRSEKQIRKKSWRCGSVWLKSRRSRRMSRTGV